MISEAALLAASQCAYKDMQERAAVIQAAFDQVVEQTLVQDRLNRHDETVAAIEAAVAQAVGEYEAEHEKCIEDIQADQLTVAERENELHDEKDRKLKERAEEIVRLRALTFRLLKSVSYEVDHACLQCVGPAADRGAAGDFICARHEAEALRAAATKGGPR